MRWNSINFDLPQALLAVISDAEFTDSDVLERRRRDHERIDGILVSRVGAENDKLAAQSTVQFLDRLLRRLNELSSKRFLREARRRVWHNTVELQHARLAGPTSMPCGSVSFRCSAPHGSPTCSHPVR